MAEISGVHVKITGDASGLKGALDDAQSELKETKKDAEQTTQSLRGLAKGLAGLAAAVVGIGGIGSLFSNVAREAQTFETSMLKINAIIRATGGVAGKTGDELLSFAKNLALNTLESTEGVLEAQQRLLTFRKVTGDVFDRTIRAAADLSASMGGNLSANAVMLGRALEDPVRGLASLTRTGTTFNESQREMIKSLVEAGKLQQAQTFILKELEAQYVGTAEEASKGYAGALDTLAQRQQEFLLAINDTLGVIDILAAATKGLASVFNVLAENMKRIVTYIATAAVAGMVAFRGAILKAGAAIMGVLIPSLAGLRVALIRTGIGAIIIGAGELIFRFTRLAEAAGGVGAAVGLIGTVFTEVGGRIKEGIELIGKMFSGLGTLIMDTFEYAFSAVSDNLNNYVLIPLTEGINAIIRAANSLGAGFTELTVPNFQMTLGTIGGGGGMDQITGAASELGELLSKPLESVQSIRDLLASIKDDKITLPDLLGTTDDDDGGGGKDGGGGAGGTDYTPQLEALREYFKTREQILIEEYAKEREMLREAFLAGQIADQEEFQELSLLSAQRYQERMAALEREKNQQRLQNTASVFGSLAQIASNAGEGMAKAAAIFGGIEAVINAYVAASQALADPSKVTPAQKFAAYASVLAAGLGAVKAIQSAGAKVGGGGGGGAGAGARSAPPQASRNVAIQLTGGDMYSRDQVIQLINSINEAVEDGAVVRLV